MTRLSDWAIPPRIWAILAAWGVGVLLIASLISAWVWTNQRQQDRDMCTMISVFLTGPEPVAGPAGERSRTVRAAMSDYYAKRDCPPR